MLVVLVREGTGRGVEGSGGEGGGCKTIDLSMNHHMGEEGGVGVLDIDLPIFSPEQSLKPVPLLFAKQTQGSPYQATFRD